MGASRWNSHRAVPGDPVFPSALSLSPGGHYPLPPPITRTCPGQQSRLLESGEDCPQISGTTEDIQRWHTAGSAPFSRVFRWMNETSRPGPQENSDPLAWVFSHLFLLCLISALYICRPGSAIVLQARSKEVGTLQLCLPVPVFPSMVGCVTTEDIRLGGWQLAMRKDLSLPTPVAVWLHAPEPPPAGTT